MKLPVLVLILACLIVSLKAEEPLFIPSWGVNTGFYASPSASDGYLFVDYQKNIFSVNSISLIGGLHFRPTPENLMVEAEPLVYYQLRENRYILNIGVENTTFIYKNTGYYLNLMCGYTFGSYNGSEKKAKTGFVPQIGGGFSFKFYEGDRVSCRFNVGFKYLKINSQSTPSIQMSIPIFFQAVNK